MTDYFDFVAVHRYMATTVDSASLLLNATLLYLILNFSNFQIHEFKWVFMLTCVGDLWLSAVILFGQPVGRGSWNRIRSFSIVSNGGASLAQEVGGEVRGSRIFLPTICLGPPLVLFSVEN